MTSTNMITWVASMTSSAFLASKKSNTDCTLHTEWFPGHQDPKQPQWSQHPQQPQWPQWLQQPHFIKKVTELHVFINPSTKMTSQCGMDHQKSTILVCFGQSFCWRLWRPKLKDKGQMSIANEHNDTFYVTYLEFKDPVNVTYIITFWVRWPCRNKLPLHLDTNPSCFCLPSVRIDHGYKEPVKNVSPCIFQ